MNVSIIGTLLNLTTLIHNHCQLQEGKEHRLNKFTEIGIRHRPALCLGPLGYITAEYSNEIGLFWDAP